MKNQVFELFAEHYDLEGNYRYSEKICQGNLEYVEDRKKTLPTKTSDTSKLINIVAPYGKYYKFIDKKEIIESDWVRNDTREKRIRMIVDYATKVIQYPKGEKGYDPIDVINLASVIDKFNQNENIRKKILNK